MNQIENELPGRSLRLLFMGVAAHEVECEEHVGTQERPDADTATPEGPSAGTAPGADLGRLFRGA